MTVISSDKSMLCETSSTPLAAHSNAWRTPNGSFYRHQHTSNNCYRITYYCALTGNYTFYCLDMPQANFCMRERKREY